MQSNKYDGINFSPITEEMSKPQTARTNQLPNNSYVVNDFDFEPLKKSISHQHKNQYSKDEQDSLNDSSREDCITADRKINQNFIQAKTADLQSPISNKFKQGLNNLLEAEMTESDFKYSDKMVQNSLQIIRQSKIQSQSQTPIKNSIQASYNQPPINLRPTKNKKKKLFIQEQPFKVDGSSKSHGYSEYNPLQDKFLKDFFSGNKLKNLKKMQKNQNPQKKQEKSNKLQEQNKSIEIKPSSSQFNQNENSKNEILNNSEEQKEIMFKYLIEITDEQKDNRKNLSQFYGSQQLSQINNLNSLTELSLDKIQISNKTMQFNKENFNTGQGKENNRYHPNYSNLYRNTKTEYKQNSINKVPELSFDKNDDFNIQLCKSPLSLKTGIQNLPQISQQGLSSNSSKQSYLPKIQTFYKNEQNQFNEVNNGQRSSSSNQNQPKENDKSEEKNNKIHNLTKHKFHSIYQPQINSYGQENQKSQVSSSKPFCTFKGVQVQIPKPIKVIKSKAEQYSQLPNLVNQRKLNLSLNLGSTSNYYQKLNDSFQEKQLDQLQHSLDNIKPYNFNTEILQNNNEQQKFTNTLTKDQFNSFLSTFKQKYSPSHKNEFGKNKMLTKQHNSYLYESKLLKQYKEHILSESEETI